MDSFDVHITTKLNLFAKKRNKSQLIQWILDRFLEAAKEYDSREIVVALIPPHVNNLGPKISTPAVWEVAKILRVLQELRVIKELKKEKSYPDELRCFRYTGQYNENLFGYGADFFDESRAIKKSIGETTERYSWSTYDFFSDKAIYAPYKRIRSSALNIFSLPGFTKKQKKDFDQLMFTDETLFGWIPAISFTDGKKVFCPLQLVSNLYFRNHVKTPFRKKNTEPMIRWSVTTGLANGKSVEDAVLAGILEIIERDAFMITYLNKLSPPRIDLEAFAHEDSDWNKIFRKFKRYNLEIHAVLLPTDFNIHAILCIVIDKTGKGPTINVGGSADFDLKKCVIDATAEALRVRHSIKETYTEPLDFSNIQRKERILFWAQAKNTEGIDFLLRGDEIKIHIPAQKSLSQKTEKKVLEERLGIIKTSLINKKMNAYYVEIGSKKLKQLGLNPLHVIIPELQPMHLKEIIPYIGGNRLKEVPKKLGYESAQKLNTIPHPFP